MTTKTMNDDGIPTLNSDAVSARVVNAVLKELHDRKGFNDWWHSIHPDRQDELVFTLMDKIDEAIVRVSLDRLCRMEPEWAANQIRNRDKLESENKTLKNVLSDIANMPEHDQDDAHRLRHKAQHAIDMMTRGGK